MRRVLGRGVDRSRMVEERSRIRAPTVLEGSEYVGKRTTRAAAFEGESSGPDR